MKYSNPGETRPATPAKLTSVPRSIRLLTPAIVFAGVAMTGCASLNFAGNASYSVEPFTTSTGATICCRVTVKDGKERSSLDLHVIKTGDNYDITLSEKNVSAFAGQQIAATAGISNAKTAAEVAAAVAAVPLAPAVLATGTLGAAAAGAGATMLLTPSKSASSPEVTK